MPSLDIHNEDANTSENMDAIASNQDSNYDKENADLIEVSPNRAKLRNKSCKHLQKQACQIIRRANLQGSPINVGNVVQIGISTVDLAKTDCKNLTLMVVEEKTFRKNPP